jgi:COP9 signalosome complex subunit 3
MDKLAAALLDFPPAGGLPDDDQYHWAAKSHSQKVDKLSVSQDFKDATAQLLDVGGFLLSVFNYAIADALQHVDPAVNSISHLSLLIAARSANSLPQADLLAKISVFLATFDARQIRYAGKSFSVVLDWLVSGTLFPVGSTRLPVTSTVANHARPPLQ